MHLADAFIQSDLHCIQVTVFTFDQLIAAYSDQKPPTYSLAMFPSKDSN